MPAKKRQPGEGPVKKTRAPGAGRKPTYKKPINSRAERIGSHPEKNKGGRPWGMKYDNTTGSKIAALLSDGGSITKIAQNPEMPTRATILKWYRDHPDFKKLMDIAVVERADYYLDKMVDIFERVERDEISIEKAKFLVDQWKWILLKMHPKFEEGRKVQEEKTGVQFHITLSNDTKDMGKITVHNDEPKQITHSEVQDAEISAPEEREVGERNEEKDVPGEDAQILSEVLNGKTSEGDSPSCYGLNDDKGGEEDPETTKEG